MRSYADYKCLTYDKPYKKYVGVRKVTKKMGYEWVNSPANYPVMGTVMKFYANGYQDGTPLATVEVIWYLKFKGPSY